MRKAPGYWRNETSGQLAPAVMRYVNGASLSADDISLIRAYLRQWIDSPVWDDNPHLVPGECERLSRLRELARVLINRESIEAWVTLATDFGIDPL